MRLLRSTAPAALVAVLLLAACAPEPDVDPQPTAPSDEPLFASEEEALAAAEEVYGEYVAAMNQILADGGENGERLAEFATPELVEQQQEGFENYISNEYRLIGETTFDSMRSQKVTLTAAPGESAVSAYVCKDVSDTDVVEPDGSSVVDAARVSRLPFEISFAASASDPTLLVSKEEAWAGDNFC